MKQLPAPVTRQLLQEKRTEREKMPRRKNATAAKRIVVDSENHGEVEVEAVVEQAAAVAAPAVAATAAVEQPVAAEPPATPATVASAAAANALQAAAIAATESAAAEPRPTLEIPAEQPAAAAGDRGLGGGLSRPADETGGPPEEKTLLQRLYDWLMT